MQGFEDTLRFLQNNNLIKCAQYIAVESTFLVSSKYDETDEVEHDPECTDCLIQRQVIIFYYVYKVKHLEEFNPLSSAQSKILF